MLTAAPEGHRLVIASTGTLLHLAPGNWNTALCGRAGMCTAAGFTVDDDHQICARCEANWRRRPRPIHTEGGI